MCGENFLRIPAPLKRPIRKQTKPSEARFDAPLLLNVSNPPLAGSNQPCSQSWIIPVLPERPVKDACHEGGMAGISLVM